MKNIKRIISVVCAIAMISTVCSVAVSAEDTPVVVTMNNNGTITQRTLNSGDAMPNPGRNERGENFFGWYTDYINWSESSKVTTVPDSNVTVYARYPSVIIDFKQINNDYFSGDTLHDGTWGAPASVTDGKLKLTVGSGRGAVIPAYDAYYNAAAEGATSQAFRTTAGKTYEVRLLGTSFSSGSQVIIFNAKSSSVGTVTWTNATYIQSWLNSDYGYDNNPRPITAIDDYDSFYMGSSDAATLTIDKIVIIDKELLEKSLELDEALDPLVAVEHGDTNILNAVTNVATVDEADLETLLQSEVKPNSVLVKYDGAITAEDIDNLYSQCNGNGVIPGLYVTTTAEVDVIVDWCNANDFWDITIASDNGELLKSIRTSRSVLRTVLCVDDTIGKTAQQLREQVRASAVTTLIIPAEQSTKELVSDLQALHVTVWSMGTEIDNVDVAWMISSGANGIVSDNHILVNTVMNEVYGENTLTKTPSVIGHRGNPKQVPENTIESFITAIQNGATDVETDVLLTEDNEIILMHDDTLNRTTNYDGTEKVSEMTLEEIRQYKILNIDGSESDTVVPTLEEMLDTLKNYNVNYVIELKSNDENLIQLLYDTIKEYGVQDRVNIVSFSGTALINTYNTDPIISAGYVGGSLTANSTDKELRINTFELIKEAQLYNATININYGNTTKEFYQLLNDRGMTLWPWTYENWGYNYFYDAFLWGVDGLTTNYAEITKDTIKTFDVDKTGTNAVDTNGSLSVNADVTTYSGSTTSVLGNVGVTWLANDIGATFDSTTGVFTAGSEEGTASFMLSYSTSLPDGSEYVLYSQPITCIVAATAQVTMNNNGNLTTENLKVGAEMPNPGKNERGEKFLGWYTDYINWSESSKVTTVPDSDVTVYARYPSIIIDFKQINNDYFIGDALHDGTWGAPASVVDGKLKVTVGSGKGAVIPAYDAYYNAGAEGATSQAFRTTAGKTYEVRLLGTSYSNGNQVVIFNAQSSKAGTVSNNGVTYIQSWIVGDSGYDANPRPITAIYDYDSFFIGGYNAATLTIDKIVIIDKELVEEAAKPDFYIGWASIREKTNEVNTGIRFKGRVGTDLVESADELGFIVCPTRLLGDAEAELVLDSTNSAILSLPVKGVYDAGDDYNDYQLCIINLIGIERGNPKLRDMRTDEFSVVMYAKTSEGTIYTEVKAATFSTLAGN